MHGQNPSQTKREFWILVAILVIGISTITGVVYIATPKAGVTSMTPAQKLTTPTAIVPEPKNVQLAPVLSDWSAKLPDGTTVYRIQDKEMNRVCYVTGAGSQMQCGAVSLTITSPATPASE